MSIIPEKLIFELREPQEGDPEGTAFALHTRKDVGAIMQRSPAFDGENFFTWTLRVTPGKPAFVDVTYFAFETGAEVPGKLLYLSSVQAEGVDYHLFRTP